MTSSRDVKSIQLIAGCGSAVFLTDILIRVVGVEGQREGDEEWGYREEERKMPGQIPGDYS